MQISGPDGIEREPRRMHFDKGKEKRYRKKMVIKKNRKT
jgi:hypothetical protein